MRKSTGISLALFLYITVTAVFLIPCDSELPMREKYITLIASYVIVLVLWLVLRKKEYLHKQMDDEIKKNKESENK